MFSRSPIPMRPSLNGRIPYALTERWSLGAPAGGYGNSVRSSVQSSGECLAEQSSAYYGGGNVGYAYLRPHPDHLFCGLRSLLTATLRVATPSRLRLASCIKFSPQLTISASVGDFWTDIEATQTALVCPTTPVLCDSGLVPRVPITIGRWARSDNGQLYGGNIGYAFSERTSLCRVPDRESSRQVAPVPSPRRIVPAPRFRTFLRASHWRGLVLSYTRQVFPSGLSGLSTTNYYTGEVGASYLLAERWRLDAGYRYTRADYPQSGNVSLSRTSFS